MAPMRRRYLHRVLHHVVTVAALTVAALTPRRWVTHHRVHCGALIHEHLVVDAHADQLPTLTGAVLR
jgi:hypothetical protein